MMVFRKILKYVIISTIVFSGIVAYLLVFHTYREKKSDDSSKGGHTNIASSTDADGDGIKNIQDIVNNARKLKGTFYEYSKGKYNNIGGRMGFLVCFDVPRIAFKNSGICFEPLLKEDYKKHPSFYDTENGNNTPATPFFFRRVRNLYSFCRANEMLITGCETPKPCDVVFYGRYHISLVSEVHNDGTFNEIEAAPWTVFTVEHKNKKWKPMDVGRLFKN